MNPSTAEKKSFLSASFNSNEKQFRTNKKLKMLICRIGKLKKKARKPQAQHNMRFKKLSVDSRNRILMCFHSNPYIKHAALINTGYSYFLQHRCIATLPSLT